jgi:c-di-GMP-binding flagellar brake protein YcgR
MPEGELSLERRKHKRAEKKLKVMYKQMAKDEAARVLLPDKKNVESEDISISGIQLICEENMQLDQILRLDIVIDPGGEPLTTFAEVRWVRNDTQLKKYRIGMEFLVIKEDHIEAIRKLIG